jgi:hypothetical protein
MTGPASRASSPLRQLKTLAALIEHVNASGWLDGAILLGLARSPEEPPTPPATWT